MDILLFSWLLGAFLFCFCVQLSIHKPEALAGWGGAIALLIVSLIWFILIPKHFFKE